MASEQQAPKQKVKLTVSQIKADLKNGIDRKGIREKYGLTAGEVNQLFQHEKLKGARVKPAPNFELEDDTTVEDDGSEGSEAVSETANAASSQQSTSATKAQSSPATQSESASNKGSW